MTRQEFQRLYKNHIIILDGATGTNLQSAGMPVGVCPEKWILEQEDIFKKLQKSYLSAGTEILYAPTFTANRIKLEEYGLQEYLIEMNQKLIALSRQVIQEYEAENGGSHFVAADLTMTGRQLFPLGELQFKELVTIYKEQAKAVADAGADLFVVETMMSLQECRAALIAIREVCDLPVMITLSFETDGRTLYGTDPVTAVNVLQSLGADAVGMNCSSGPLDMVEPIRKMSQVARIPLIAKPNAGMPELVDGRTIYSMQPEEFAAAGQELIKAGARILGGCCGTTAAHIKAIAKIAAKEQTPFIPAEKKRILSSERKTVEIQLDGPFQVVGERINPTGKKKLQEELRAGNLELAAQMAREQEEAGAAILDINVGTNGIDELAMMQEMIYEISSTVDCPLCIDSSYVEVIEAALRIYPGRALINSISLEKEKIEKLLPIAKKYGAMFILLPLSDAGLPKTPEEKNAVIELVLKKAFELGFAKEDVVVDGLVATVGANANAALECFDTIEYCKNELQVATICGLSNISFGLPERSNVNTAFLTIAISKGLTMAIANPSQELLVNASFASDMLLHKKGSDIRYINRMNDLKEKKEADTSNALSRMQGEKKEQTPGDLLYDCVLKGNRNSVIDHTKEVLDQGMKPGDIIDRYLIAAINEVGELFDQKKYFLPQLIASANAMKYAIDYLEPMMEKEKEEAPKATLVIATVEGDIHDIGKNLVVLMLKNYGYRVIDMGKDIPAESIVETAIREDAKIIGLSALMTTTMMRMKDVVTLAREKGCKAKIIIGGATITPSFAEEIGADGYSKDAADCVKLVEKLL